MVGFSCLFFFFLFWSFWAFPESFAACSVIISAYISTLVFSASVLSSKTFFTSFAPSSLRYPPYTTYTTYTTLSQHSVSVAQPEPHQPIVIHQLQHHFSPPLHSSTPTTRTTQTNKIKHGSHLLARRRRNRPSQTPPKTLPLRPPLIYIAPPHNTHLLLRPLRRSPTARPPCHVRYLRCISGESCA